MFLRLFFCTSQFISQCAVLLCSEISLHSGYQKHCRWVLLRYAYCLQTVPFWSSSTPLIRVVPAAKHSLFYDPDMEQRGPSCQCITKSQTAIRGRKALLLRKTRRCRFLGRMVCFSFLCHPSWEVDMYNSHEFKSSFRGVFQDSGSKVFALACLVGAGQISSQQLRLVVWAQIKRKQ